MKVASVRHTAEFYYRRSTFHVHPVSSILTENRAALKESSFRSAKEIVCTDFGGGSLRSRLIVAAVLFVREASTIARHSRRLIRKRAINALETTDAPLLSPGLFARFSLAVRYSLPFNRVPRLHAFCLRVYRARYIGRNVKPAIKSAIDRNTRS